VLFIFDYDGLILLRDVEINKNLIKKFKIDLSKWEAPKADLFKLGTFRIKPYRPYYRGYTLESLGLDNASLDELKEAIRIDPFYADVHDLLGKIYAKRKEYLKSFEHFRISVTASPNNIEKRHNLALSYFDLNEYEGAAKQYEEIVRIWPDDPKGYYLLSKSYIGNEQYAEALNILGKVHKLSPNNVGDLLILADIMYENKAYSEAKDVYLMVLEVDEQLATIHKKLGLTLIELDDEGQAREELYKAQKLAPDDPDISQALQSLL